MNKVRPIKIAIMALGGQGGGVLTNWIVEAAERSGYIAQSTSVPGVAQRTGATIYYVEAFPQSASSRPPILALMPTPGDVDIVIAAELMEAGRALQRGFITSGTTLIASTHRVYAIGEKIAMADGRLDATSVRAAAASASKRSIWLDMASASQEAGSAISAVMFGALAGSRAAPFSKEAFEETIKQSGKSVDRNLAGFTKGFEGSPALDPDEQNNSAAAAGGNDSVQDATTLFRSKVDRLPVPVQATAAEGFRRAVDFQDARYGELYLRRVEAMVAADRRCGRDARNFRLSNSVARCLALAMTYDDVVRVADLKTRAARFERFRKDARAADDQIVRVWEYMHPRVEEICDLLPPKMAGVVLNTKFLRGAITAILGKGRRVSTTNISGFLLLNTLASLRFLRRSGLRFKTEQARIDDWLARISTEVGSDYALAEEICATQRLIKGYGETHARGLGNYRRILAAIDRIKASGSPAATLARLRDCALRDEEGAALSAALSKLEASPIAA